MVQDEKGLIYVANTGGVEYDGVSWRMIRTSDRSSAGVVMKSDSDLGALECPMNLRKDLVRSRRFLDEAIHTGVPTPLALPVENAGGKGKNRNTPRTFCLSLRPVTA